MMPSAPRLWQPAAAVSGTSRAVSQAVTIDPSARLVLISGQLGRDESGNVVHRDPRGQAEAAFANLERALNGTGASWDDVVMLRFYATNVEAFNAVRDVRERLLGDPRPAATGLIVAGLAQPEYLLEVEAMAAVPGPAGDDGPRR